MRSLLRPVDDTLFIGFFLILFTAQEKRIGDLLANTLVVQVEQGQANVAPVKTSEAATPIAHQLEELADLSLMSPSDFVIIRSNLSRRDRLQAEARSQVSLNLAQQTQALIALDTLPSDMTPDVFLEAVYLAYQAAT